ncbi:MAG: LysE family transporter [bacterium]|nr:LysE family transporter [bacterium]
MSLSIIFITSFLVALSGALMPGPLLTVTIAYSLRRGFWSGPLVVLGHAILELILLLGIVLGLADLLRVPMVIRIISVIGGLALICMGADFIRSFRKIKIGPDRTELQKMTFNPLFGGIVISLSNPYWIIWWVTIGLVYMTRAMKLGFFGIAAFYLGHILADLAWYSVISFGFGKGKVLIKNTVYHLIILFCGIFLAFFGLWFLYDGFK